MKLKDLKTALRQSLKAEERSVKERFAGLATAAERPAAERQSTPPPIDPDAISLPEPAETYRSLIETLRARYLRVGFDPDRAHVVAAALEALNALPGVELRRHMRAVTGERKSRPPPD